MAMRCGGGRSDWQWRTAFAGAAVLVALGFFWFPPKSRPTVSAVLPAEPSPDSAALPSLARKPPDPVLPLPLNEALLREARRILASARSTKYSHKNQVDEKSGTYELDCSGYVGLVLSRVAPASYARLRRSDGKGPLAADYERVLEKAPADPAVGDWLQIEKVADLRPGDLIVWRYAQPEVGHTGHVMILAAEVEADGAAIYKLAVLESTGATHLDAKGREQTGLREGWLWLQTDAAGHPTGFRRSNGLGKFRVEPIALGRLLR